MDRYPRLSLVQLSRYASFLQTLRLAKLADFQGVDVDIAEMKHISKSRSIEEVKQLVDDKGLRLGGWGLPANIYGDEETYLQDLQRLPDYARIAVELECKRVFTWLHPFSDSLPFKENFEFHVERLRPIAEILEDHGCLLGLEFAGTKSLRTNRRYEFIYTIDGILELCEAIGTKNLGLLLDSWDWYTTYGTIDCLRRLNRQQVIYVQVNDAPPRVPIEEQKHFVRCLPGETDVIDLVGFLRALREIRYEGPITPEPFSASALISLISVSSSLSRKNSSINHGVENILPSYFWIIQKFVFVTPRTGFALMHYLKKLREKFEEEPFMEVVKLTGRFMNRIWIKAGLS